MSGFDVGYRSAFLRDRLEEVKHMKTCRRRGVQFDALLGKILGVFLFFIDDILVNLFSFSSGCEIAFHGAAAQCSFFAIQDKRPRIVRVSGGSPGAVLPYTVEAIVFEDGGLRIRDIRLSFLLNVYPAR